MPEVDFMVVCDYVRTEGGLLHMIAAGVDRIRPQRLPMVQQFGVGVRLSLTRVECDVPHEVQLVFQDEDGQRIMQMDAEVRVSFPERSLPGGKVRTALALNVGVPLQQSGGYSFELLVDRQMKKSVDMIVDPPRSQQG